MDQPNLEVSLQEANLDPSAQPQKAEGNAAPAPASEAKLETSDGAHGDPHGDAASEEPAKPRLIARVRALLKDLFASLFSLDSPTRKTALLFFAGIVGVGIVSVAAVKRISHVRAQRALAQKAREAEEKRLHEIESSRLSDLTSAEKVVSLGRYMLALRPGASAPQLSGSSASRVTADFELFARCNEKEVREYIEARTVQVRSELTSALVGMTREDFLAVDGKRRTHKKILLTLNQWLAREYSGARIEDVWFGDLTVE